MTSKRIKSLVLAAGLLIGSMVGVGSTFADMTGMDSMMTISPPSQRVILTPGEDYEGSISVSSSSTAKNDLVYSVTIGAFGYVRDENGNVDYDDVDTDTITSYNQIMDWIELKKDKGTVMRGETEAIPFVIHVPEDAPAGGQYATIIVQDDTNIGATGGEGVAFESKVRFASNLVAEVTGETRNEGVIVDNDIPGFLMNNQLTATSTVKNDGNVHTDAEYVLQVWPLFGDEEICTNEEDPDTSLVMPDTDRYHAQTCSLPSVGIYRAKQTVKIFGEVSVVEKTVIACPLWLLFLILFAVIALIIWIVSKVHGGKRRKSASGSEE